jgi:hypothetical protein
VFTARLDAERATAASNAAPVPKTSRGSTFTTRPFRRDLWTVAYSRLAGATRYGFRGRPRFPVRGGVTITP